MPHPLDRYIILKTVIGSRAYGLDTDASDTDRRGIYLPPADLHWSLAGAPEQIEDKDNQECYWELQKFLTLALKANPNILECLYTPLVEHASSLALELLAMRDIFLSKRVHQTYNGYVATQFKKLQHHLNATGEIKWKHAMHLIRLLIAGITILQTGTLDVRVPPEHRGKLLALKHGQIPWRETDEWRDHLQKTFDAAAQTTTLPDQPDEQRAEAFLIKARRSML